MCVDIETLKLDGSGDVCTSVYDLARSIGCLPADLVSISHQPLDEDECICDLDVIATAGKFGYRVTFNPEDGHDIRLTQEQH